LKNQYFGDINDYRKYGLLRGFLDGGSRGLFVAWMLTPDDGRSDGRRVQYLQRPEKWRHFDPDLYSGLRAMLRPGRTRAVGLIEHSALLPRCRFFSELVPDRCEPRAGYFVRLGRAARGAELIFLDPDNGLEVRSKPPGCRGSSKYVYWHEVEGLFSEGHSLLIYQHFRRTERQGFVRSLARELAGRLGIRSTLTFRTPHVLFLLAAQPRHTRRLRGCAEALAARWREQIQLGEHSAA
jgi:hypothetical protein